MIIDEKLWPPSLAKPAPLKAAPKTARSVTMNHKRMQRCARAAERYTNHRAEPDQNPEEHVQTKKRGGT